MYVVIAFVGIVGIVVVLLLGGLMRAASKPKPKRMGHPAYIRAKLNRLYDERGYPRDPQ